MKSFTFLIFALLAVQASNQVNQSKPTAASAAAKEQTTSKNPTLGFNRIKDVPPIIDSDAMIEAQKLEKQLPGNEFVHGKEGLHEAGLMGEFVEGFQNAKECNGITFYLKTDKKPDFTVQIMVSGHDDPKVSEQTWTWMLGYPADPSPLENKSHGVGGMGTQSNGKLTARDVCLTIWDDVDLNHFKKPGGKVE